MGWARVKVVLRVLSVSNPYGIWECQKLAKSLWPTGLPPLATVLHQSLLGDKDLSATVGGLSLGRCIIGNWLTGGKAAECKGDPWKQLLQVGNCGVSSGIRKLLVINPTN